MSKHPNTEKEVPPVTPSQEDGGSPTMSEGSRGVGEEHNSRQQRPGTRLTDEFLDDVAATLVGRLSAVADRWRDEHTEMTRGATPGPMGDPAVEAAKSSRARWQK